MIFYSRIETFWSLVSLFSLKKKKKPCKSLLVNNYMPRKKNKAELEKRQNLIYIPLVQRDSE